jgi:hypothetical protein
MRGYNGRCGELRGVRCVVYRGGEVYGGGVCCYVCRAGGLCELMDRWGGGAFLGWLYMRWGVGGDGRAGG